MKLVAIVSLTSVFAIAAQAQLSFTYETDKVLTAAGDFAIADGRKDLIVADRLTGNLTFGQQNADGSLTWSAPEPSGMTGLTGLAVDRFEGGTTDRAALTAPAANRVTLATLNASASQAIFRHLNPTYPSPRGLAPFDPNADGIAELFIVGDRTTPSPRYYYELLGNIPTIPSQVWEASFNLDTTRIHRFVQKTGTAPLVAETYGAQFYVETVLPTGLGTGRALSGLSINAATLMTYGNFDGTVYAQVILYNPGATTASAAKVTEATPGTFGWSAISTLSFPKAVKQLVTIPMAAGGARLGVVFSDLTAAVYNYDGSTLTLRSNLFGTPFDWLTPIGNDILISKNNLGWQRFNTSFNNLNLTPTHAGTFPNLAAKNRVSNVVFFSAEPFADPAAAPLAQGSVRDWSTAVTGSATSWNVTAADVSSAGIGSPLATTYTSPVSSTHALPNQFRPNISLRNLESAAGTTLPDVIIQPAGGVFRPGDDVTLRFNPTISGNGVKYRIGNGAWTDYILKLPPVLTTNNSVEAYAFGTSGKSPIRSASFTFSNVPALTVGATTDANGNGLPDAWEKAFNITNPAADADGDGANNIAEYEGGTDPRNASELPPAAPLVLRSERVVISNQTYLRLSWDLALGTAVLQTSTDLRNLWQPVSSGITVVGNEKVYLAPMPAGPPNAAFFRLRQP